MMYEYMHRLAGDALDRRLANYEKLKNPPEIRAYQKRMRKAFLAQLGGFPKRTPLNPRTVGRIRRTGHTIEKVIYEAQPRHFVSALLYLPSGKSPHPCVLVPPGHTDNGKIGYQRQCVMLARNGLSALCWDPIGQGERHQLIGPDGSVLTPPTWEHTIVSPGSLAVGRNVATYMVWDAIRSLDYLCTRKEIDPGRIGCTGNSGGGMLTCYLMAIDDRIACAAPSCYVTTYRRLLETIGPQDSEQNVPGLLAIGMDHPDYLIIRAPKPTLICCATRDFFDIEGTWDTFRQAKRIYTRLGFADRVDLVETDWTHGFTTHLRVAMVRWMRRWLLGIDDEVTEQDAPLLEDRKLLCTKTGETLDLPQARSVFDLNRDLGTQLTAKRRKTWATTPKRQMLNEVRRITGIRRASRLPQPKIRKLATTRRKSFRIERMVIIPEEGITLPAMMFAPRSPSGQRYLYLDGRGMDRAVRPDGPVRKLVGEGHLVLAGDLRGLGQTRTTTKRYNLGQFVGMDWSEATIGLLLNRPILTMRAEDVLVLTRYLAGWGRGGRRKVNIIATGLAGPPVLHAAALEPHLFASVELRRSPISWSNILEHTITKDQLASVVHAVLRIYDLDDLVRVLGDKLTVTDPADATNRKIAPAAKSINRPVHTKRGILTSRRRITIPHADQ
jgi:dienelactone hydrolase